MPRSRITLAALGTRWLRGLLDMALLALALVAAGDCARLLA